MFGKKKVEEFYQKATGQFLRKKTWPHKLKMDYTLKVLLCTDVDKKDPDRDMEGDMDLNKESQKTHKKFLTKVSKSPQVLGWNFRCVSR